MATQRWRDANKEHVKEYKNNWYKDNNEKHKRDVKERRRRTKEWLRNYKSKLSCIKCGENHPACLDFHHIDPTQKDSQITNAISRGWSMERLIKEIEKCEVLCANCHRKEHYEGMV